MELTMLENGLDFVIDAISHLKRAEQDDCKNKEQEIKYSLLHLSSGIELILKSRLFREHWTYIFSDMNKANRQDLNNGSFRSVESGALIERLERLCDVSLSKESQDALEKLRRLRNQMEHFTIKETLPAVESCINNSLKAINKFIANNYCDFTSPIYLNLKGDDEIDGLKEREQKLIEELIKRTAELKEHYDDALKMAIAKAGEEVLIEELVVCPSCKEKSLKCNYNDTNRCHCFFCSYEEDGEKAANEHLSVIQGLNEYEIVKDGGEYPLYDCPECGKHAFVNADGTYTCFSCGMYYDEDEINFCGECGALYIIENDDLGLCSSCIEYKMSE